MGTRRQRRRDGREGRRVESRGNDEGAKMGEHPKRGWKGRLRKWEGGEEGRGPAKERRRHPYFGRESCCGVCSSGVICNLFCCCCFVLLVIFNFD